MKTRTVFFCALLLSLTGIISVRADEDLDPAGSANAPTYKESGYSAMMRIGSELYKTLDAKHQPKVHIQPISLDTDVTPFVKAVEYPDEDKPLRIVFVSVGFIDLLNNVAHAKAIDKIQKGYFEKYVLSLGQETGEKSLKELPNLSDKRFWTEEVMNEQLSNFNQMVGMVVGMKLSHHYLGHYQKYHSQLADTGGKATSIFGLLTPNEWEQTLYAGARNALDAGYGVEGVKSLYEAIDKMPARPAWTSYFLPEKVKVSKVKKELERIESDFFKGK
jgi:hypothetical protein